MASFNSNKRNCSEMMEREKSGRGEEIEGKRKGEERKWRGKGEEREEGSGESSGELERYSCITPPHYHLHTIKTLHTTI